jgi:transcriptional regulator with XRE-family HTH domain
MEQQPESDEVPGASGDPGRDDVPGLPLLPGFREMALRRMSAERRRLVADLTAQRRSAGLSQTEVAARMGTSQSAVARLETGEADVRVSTLERYAAAIGSQLAWHARPGQVRPGEGQPGHDLPGQDPPGLERPRPGQPRRVSPYPMRPESREPGSGEPQAGPGQEYR